MTIGIAVFLIYISFWYIRSCMRRKQITEKDREALEQISDLKLQKRTVIKAPDSEVTVVLLNMGGPKTIADVRPFLLRVFMDSRIIRFPLSSLLQGFFAKMLVTLRGKATEHRYGLIGGGSPILESTQNQAEALNAELKRRGRDLYTTICFNYSWPLPEDAVAELKKQRKKYILPLSLYPHYSEATTGSSFYYLKEEIKKSFSEARVLDCPSYFLDNHYIAAFADRINEQLKPGESLDDFYLLFSAHGLPLYFLVDGDPYPFQVAQSVAKILDALGRKDRWTISYQSAVGPLEWMKPSTDSVMKALARRGEHRILVVPISFVSDHIETLCEIDIEYRAMAEQSGIKDFRMSRAIESHPEFITALADCVESSLTPKEDQQTFAGRGFHAK